MTRIRGELSQAAAIPSSHAEAIGQLAGAGYPDGRLRRSANTLLAGVIFQKIRGDRNAFGGFGDPRGDLAGPGDVLRGEDGAHVCDQRLPGSARKAPDGALLAEPKARRTIDISGTGIDRARRWQLRLMKTASSFEIV